MNNHDQAIVIATLGRTMQTLEQLFQQKETLRRENEELRRSKEELTHQIKCLCLQIKVLQKDNGMLQTKLFHLCTDQQADMWRRNKSLQEENERLQKDNRTLQTKLFNLHTEQINEMLRRNEDLQQENERMQKTDFGLTRDIEYFEECRTNRFTIYEGWFDCMFNSDSNQVLSEEDEPETDEEERLMDPSRQKDGVCTVAMADPGESLQKKPSQWKRFVKFTHGSRKKKESHSSDVSQEQAETEEEPKPGCSYMIADGWTG